MANHQQLVMEREPKLGTASAPPIGGIKTILLHILDDEFHDRRIDTALSLARACSGHITCLHVTPIEAYVAFDSFGGVYVMNDVIKAIEERDSELRRRVEARFSKEDVTWDYEQVTGNVASVAIGRAALADVIITSRQVSDTDWVSPTLGLLGDVLQRSRTPLLIPGAEAAFDPLGPAFIAWNGSFEAANAVRASLGLLRLSREVKIIEVPEGGENAKAFPGTRLLEYLSRQGVHAEYALTPSPTGDVRPDIVAGIIVSQAQGAGASYVVLGGYSHSRIGEFVFGGITRALLNDCPLALMIAH